MEESSIQGKSVLQHWIQYEELSWDIYNYKPDYETMEMRPQAKGRVRKHCQEDEDGETWWERQIDKDGDKYC